MFDFSIMTSWMYQTLTSVMPEGLVVFIECIVIGMCIVALYTILVILLIYMEHRVYGFFQYRLGPNRVGRWGNIQVLCDALKVVAEEVIELKHSDKFLYNLALLMVIIVSFLIFSCPPVSKGSEVLDFSVGVFFLLVASSIGAVDILLAGWGSNNKFSPIGAVRSGTQIIGYELFVELSTLTVVVLMDTAQFSEIVKSQTNGWFISKGHIPVVITFTTYLVAGNAECNRGPFDLSETRSELIAGYHIEYLSMRFGFFYLTEYLNMSITAAAAATVFLGGRTPLYVTGSDGFNAVVDYIPGFIWFFSETFFVVFLLMWIKWTFPRLHTNQVLNLEWKYLVPILMVNLAIMVLIVVLGPHF